MPIAVRQCNLEDSKKIIELGKWVQQNSSFSSSGWSEAKAKKIVELGASDTNVFLYVAEDGDDLVGFFIGVCQEHYFSDLKVANDLVVAVDPSNRRSAYAALRLLIPAFEEWAKARGAKDIFIGTTTEIASEAYTKFLQRQGYRVVGYNTKKEVQ